MNMHQFYEVMRRLADSQGRVATENELLTAWLDYQEYPLFWLWLDRWADEEKFG